MIPLLRRHWIPLAIALFAVVLLFGKQHEKDRETRRADEADRKAAVWQGRWEAERDARAVAEVGRDSVAVLHDSLRAEFDSIASALPRVVVRWRSLPVDAPDSVRQAAGDSLAAVCESVIGHCRAALGSAEAKAEAERKVAEGFRRERDAQFNRAQALAESNAALRRALEGGDPIWPTLALTAGGGLLGYAVDGPRGALYGVGIGVGVDVVRRGVQSLVESLP